MTQSPAAAPVGKTTPSANERRKLRRLRADLRFLWLYVHTTRRVCEYEPHAAALAASDEPVDIADRIEDQLAQEAWRYRAMGWCILALVVALPMLAAFLWSAMYWLPVRVYWWPFERGNYGLPFLSLFEWLAYLVLAAYFVVTGALLYASHTNTRRLSTEYRRLIDASDERRAVITEALVDGEHVRAEYVVEHSKVFSAYEPLLKRSATS